MARMNDHRFIRNGGATFSPLDALAAHRASRDWLKASLAADPAAVKVVVTHHAPAATMLGRRAGDIAPCYGSELLPDFAAARPALWVHGHTHYRHVSVVEGILVVSAPRGYVVAPEDDALRFMPGVVEI